MRIALVTYALHAGGMETFLFGLANGLSRHGIDVTFVVTDYIGVWHDRPKDLGFDVITLTSSLWESPYAHANRVARTLSSFDVILLNHSLAAQSSAGLLPESCVVISILHSDLDLIYNLGLSNIANIDKIVAVSERVKNRALSLVDYPEKICAIRNGVEVFDNYVKTHIDIKNSPLRCVFLGRITNDSKGVFYLPKIISEINNHDIAISLDVIGDGKDKLELQEMFNELKIDGLVTFHGLLPHEDAMNILVQCDVLLLPSHYEGQPITLFEAMARGVVPVVSRLPGITDSVVTDGLDGLLVDIGDIEGFVEALSDLALDAKRVAKMSMASWQKASNEFSIDTMTQGYIDIIASCLELRKKVGKFERDKAMDIAQLGPHPNVLNLFLKIVKRIELVLEKSSAKHEKISPVV